VTTEISWDEKNRKLRMNIPAFGLRPEIKRSLKGPMQEFAANIAEKGVALRHFPALSEPILLQFFGDLDTGQQLDGSISFMLDESVPGSSKWEYRATLTGSEKKSSEPAISMKFIHDLDLAWGEGQISFVQWVPEVPASEKN